MPPDLRHAELEDARRGAVEALQAGVAVEHQQRVIDAVLDALELDVEFLRLGGLDLQFFVDRRQLFVGRLQFFVRRFEFLVRSLHLLVRGLNLLVQRLHFLVRGFQLLDQRLQVFARRRQLVLELLVGDVAAVFERALAGGRLQPLDTDHEQRFRAGD